MKYRPSKRFVWLVIPLLPVAAMWVAVWIEEESAASSIATRGSSPPRTRLLTRTQDLYEEGISELGDWGLDTRKAGPQPLFGSRFHALRDSKVPQDLERYGELMKLGKEWYERILPRYPELAVAYKNIPEEKNGLLQWQRFEKRLRESSPVHASAFKLSGELKDHFRDTKPKPWNPVAVKAWLDINRPTLDEARAIALIPDQSSRGISAQDERRYPAFMRTCAIAFLVEARLLAENGDPARAMDSIRAVSGIVNQLRNAESPTEAENYQRAYVQQASQRYVILTILPSLPAGGIDFPAWEKALDPAIQQPSDFSRIVRGEWNEEMRSELLPILADTNAPGNPSDGEVLAEAYTLCSGSLVKQNEHLTLIDLPSHPPAYPGHDHLSRRSRAIALNLGILPYRFERRKDWERDQTESGMILAAFAIFKGEPVPCDPFYGLPYRWDPVTRKLSEPELSARRNQGMKSMILPKL
jgi:hypothetical protein